VRSSPATAPRPSRPTLSVVVPTLDEEERLPELLASLAASAPDGPDEIVVADGGSRDRTVQVAERAGARVVRAPRGRGAQLAHGARATTGDVLLFLHADSRVSPTALAAVRSTLDGASAPIAVGLRQRIEGRGALYRLIERGANLRVRLGIVYGDSGLAVRRGAYEAVGGFREVPLFEDLDLARRLRRRGPVRLAGAAVLTISARRWRRDGVLRRTLLNWCLTAAWLAGVDPARLARYYPAQGAEKT
jgi:rSAM/selenodomain-associated transferase 2